MLDQKETCYPGIHIPADNPADQDSTITSIEDTYTTFQEMYDFFLAGITDDMFMELTKEDTEAILEEILLAAMPHFEFPRWANPFDLDMQNKRFTTLLNAEEKMIIRQYMISEWIGYQLATIDLIRQKYSGSDFKFTSQASHLKQLTTLKKEYETKGFHLQRVYCRRSKDDNGHFKSTFSSLAAVQPAWKKTTGRTVYGSY